MLENVTTTLEDVFGTYEPIITSDTSGNIIDVSINFGYIAAVVIICICLIFIFKTIGGLLYEWLR